MSQLKHIPHLEELFVLDGEEGFKKSIQILSKCMAMLTKQPASDFHINVKFDGSPSIVWGYHPKHGDFFVAKKSIFNKTPIFYTDENSIFNAKLDEKLQDIFCDMFHFLVNVTPMGHIYQGDFLYNFSLINRKNEFQPNLIKYKSNNGRNFGVSVHTRYFGDSIETIKQSSYVNHSSFKKYNDTEIVNPTYVLKNNYNYSKFLEYLSVLEYTYDFYYKNRNVLNSFSHEEKQYFLKEVNNCIRMQTSLQSNPLFHSNMKFYIYSCLHKVLQDLKNTIIGHLNICLDYSKYPMPIAPFDVHEGYVVTLGHIDEPTKLIHRHLFSKLNFDKYSKKYGKKR